MGSEGCKFKSGGQEKLSMFKQRPEEEEDSRQRERISTELCDHHLNHL